MDNKIINANSNITIQPWRKMRGRLKRQIGRIIVTTKTILKQ